MQSTSPQKPLLANSIGATRVSRTLRRSSAHFMPKPPRRSRHPSRFSSLPKPSAVTSARCFAAITAQLGAWLPFKASLSQALKRTAPLASFGHGVEHKTGSPTGQKTTFGTTIRSFFEGVARPRPSLQQRKRSHGGGVESANYSGGRAARAAGRLPQA